MDINKVKIGDKVQRNGKYFDVVDILPSQGNICVHVEMDYADYPYKRKIKCWWDTKNVTGHLSVSTGSYRDAILDMN